mgnify:CR=1 FL=1
MAVFIRKEFSKPLLQNQCYMQWRLQNLNKMEREEVSKRFNALPREHRVTIIGNELEQEIRWIEREKRDAISAHKKNLDRYNERIKTLTKSLKDLKD